MGETTGIVVQLVVPFVVGLLGMAVGYGATKRQTTVNTKAISRLYGRIDGILGVGDASSPFVFRDHCEMSTQASSKRDGELKEAIDRHGRQLRRLDNFARWVLTNREGLELDKVNEILNGE
jgi:hypothetical protein